MKAVGAEPWPWMVGVQLVPPSVPWVGVGQLPGAGVEVGQPLLGQEPKLWEGKQRVLVGASSFKSTVVSGKSVTNMASDNGMTFHKNAKTCEKTCQKVVEIISDKSE